MIDALTKNNKIKGGEIKELKEKNHSLNNTLEFWKDKFLRVIFLIKNKLFGKEKKWEKYMDVSEDVKDTFIFSKNKDDFELEI